MINVSEKQKGERKMNQLAILENNLEFSRKLLNYIIGNNKKIQLINMSVNVEEIKGVLNLLGKKDILLVDLNVPEINIDELISILSEKGRNVPYVVCITNNMKQCEKLKDYVYDIIRNTHSFNKIISIINQITSMVDKQFYERLIKEELNNFEINITTLGYEYIVEGLMLSIEDDNLLKDFQNGLYKTLAIKHNLPKNYNIKWAVEKCIKATVRYTDFEVVKSYFHVETTEKVTPKLFISIIVENLKNKMVQELDA